MASIEYIGLILVQLEQSIVTQPGLLVIQASSNVINHSAEVLLQNSLIRQSHDHMVPEH